MPVGGGQYEAEQARRPIFYGAGQQGRRHHAEGDIVPPFVVENPRPGHPSSFPSQELERARTGDPERRAAPRPSRGRNREEGSHLPRYELQRQSIYLERAGDREQRRSERRPPGPRGPVPGGRLGRHHPAVSVASTRTGSSRRSRATTGARPVRRSGRKTAASLPCLPSLQRSRLCWNASKTWATVGSLPTSGTSTRTRRPSSRRRGFQPLHAGAAEPRSDDGVRLRPRRGRVQVKWDGGMTCVLTGNELPVSSNSDRCTGSITIVKKLVPPDDPGRFSLKINDEVAGGAAAVGDSGTTNTIAVQLRPAHGERVGSAGTSLDDYQVEDHLPTTGRPGRATEVRATRRWPSRCGEAPPGCALSRTRPSRSPMTGP